MSGGGWAGWSVPAARDGRGSVVRAVRAESAGRVAAGLAEPDALPGVLQGVRLGAGCLCPRRSGERRRRLPGGLYSG